MTEVPPARTALAVSVGGGGGGQGLLTRTAPTSGGGGEGGGSGLHAGTAPAVGEGGGGGDRTPLPQTAPTASGGGEGDGGRAGLEDGLPTRVAMPEYHRPVLEQSDEVPAGSWRGWRGIGRPREVTFMGRPATFHDGGGLCSPGRWPPGKRRFPPGIPAGDCPGEGSDERRGGGDLPAFCGRGGGRLEVHPPAGRPDPAGHDRRQNCTCC